MRPARCASCARREALSRSRLTSIFDTHGDDKHNLQGDAMTQSTVELATRDGVCRTWIFQPEGAGPWPAVLFFMDGLGVRPALFTMAERIAARGYLVALPDLFYRSG